MEIVFRRRLFFSLPVGERKTRFRSCETARKHPALRPGPRLVNARLVNARLVNSRDVNAPDNA
jgi:hypothetical protein